MIERSYERTASGAQMATMAIAQSIVYSAGCSIDHACAQRRAVTQLRYEAAMVRPSIAESRVAYANKRGADGQCES